MLLELAISARALADVIDPLLDNYSKNNFEPGLHAFIYEVGFDYRFTKASHIYNSAEGEILISKAYPNNLHVGDTFHGFVDGSFPGNINYHIIFEEDENNVIKETLNDGIIEEILYGYCIKKPIYPDQIKRVIITMLDHNGDPKIINIIDVENTREAYLAALEDDDEE